MTQSLFVLSFECSDTSSCSSLVILPFLSFFFCVDHVGWLPESLKLFFLPLQISRLNDDLERKECKWSNALNKLQDQLKFLERENQQLHEENHKIKVKNISSKVQFFFIPIPFLFLFVVIMEILLMWHFQISTRLVEPSTKKANGDLPTHPSQTPLLSQAQQVPSSSPAFEEVEGQGIKETATNYLTPPGPPALEEDNLQPAKNGKLVDVTPRMVFSPADSLESNVTLVSAGMTTTTSDVKKDASKVCAESEPPKTFTVVKVQSVKRDEMKGTTEKIYTDGHSEICYNNGNRKEISADGKTIKVFYYNGDVKESLPSGLVKYFYSQTKTWHFTYPDRKEVLQFNK